MIEIKQSGEGLQVATLNRSPVNALDFDLIRDCEEAFAALAAHPPARGLILTGTGPTFSAGVDVRAFGGYDRDTRHAMVLAITRMTAALLAIPCPVVAAINGHALGGGFVLALCCDFRLVTDDPAIKLGMPEAQAGVPFPAGPRRIIQSELAPPLLRRLALSSLILPPRDLVGAGVLDALTMADDLLAGAEKAMDQLSAQPGFAAVKRQIRGDLADEVARLAASGTDPYLDSFG